LREKLGISRPAASAAQGGAAPGGREAPADKTDKPDKADKDVGPLPRDVRPGALVTKGVPVRAQQR
ncbi:MAG TPA: hypothetical protein VK881_05300, partial [bacterium]|nr:hypothetical protein [bacterium]